MKKLVKLWENTNGTLLLDLLSVRQGRGKAEAVQIGRNHITDFCHVSIAVSTE